MMSKEDKTRNRSYLSRVTYLEKKADKIADTCGAQIVILCYSVDGKKTFFHGRPSIDYVLNRYVAEHGYGFLGAGELGASSSPPPLAPALLPPPQAAGARASPPPPQASGTRASPLDAFYAAVANINMDEISPSSLAALESSTVQFLKKVQARMGAAI